MLLLFIQDRSFIQIADKAIDASAYKTLASKVVQQMYVFAFAVLNHGCQQHKLAALRQRQHLIHHLTHGLCIERLSVLRTTGFPGAGKQQTQVIVDLSNGAHGGARVVRGRLLLNGNRGGQAFHMVHIGFFHH